MLNGRLYAGSRPRAEGIGRCLDRTAGLVLTFEKGISRWLCPQPQPHQNQRLLSPVTRLSFAQRGIGAIARMWRQIESWNVPYDCSGLLRRVSLDVKLSANASSVSEASRRVEGCRVSVGDCESEILEYCEWGSMAAGGRCTTLMANPYLCQHTKAVGTRRGEMHGVG